MVNVYPETKSFKIEILTHLLTLFGLELLPLL
jgi:hypothetical protein